MILKQGKFYDEAGNVVPLEFGNKEQFDLLERANNLIEKGEEWYCDFVDKPGEPVTHWGIKCVCGGDVKFPYKEDLNGEKTTCECGLKYYCTDIDDGFVVVKMKKPKK